VERGKKLNNLQKKAVTRPYTGQKQIKEEERSGSDQADQRENGTPQSSGRPATPKGPIGLWSTGTKNAGHSPDSGEGRS